MPGWQQFYQKHRASGIELLSVALDAHGAGRAEPYLRQAKAEFVTVVDEQNLLGDLYGFKAIPNGFLIDEQGILRYGELGTFDVRKPKTRALLDQWVAGKGTGVARSAEAPGNRHAQANAHFRAGEALYRQGKVDEAVAEWRRAVALEPDNYIIRKQIWAVQNPDKFYDGDVDYDWQDEQLKKGL
ncbi:MAG: tetratricopeptide repeat protein [SAR202 cluster bacterium]|nr:tetratricopeptide repeat protein [SAR202 cluster bacterium]